MCRFCWFASLVLAMTVAAMSYLFMIRGSVGTVSHDGRVAIVLTVDERDLVLGEMRGFLESVETIVRAVKEKDMKAAYEAGHKAGMAAAGDVPVSLMGKLPLSFKQLGMATHKAFDDLAAEARDMGDPQVVLGKLADLLGNCTTCHAGYRFTIEKAKGK